MSFDLQQAELILGNSNQRFSGVTSTMLQVIRYQKDITKLVVLGSHHLPDGISHVTFRQLIKLCRKPLSNGRYRVFHARRNNEVIQALILKKCFGAKIRVAFTSTAQREHSWITRYLIRQSDAVISTCSAAASYIKDGPDIIIPHGIDLDTYSPAEDRPALWREKQSFQDKLEAEVDAAGLTDRFLFLGKQPFSELPKLFKAMTIVTALSRNEGFGLTILEAMASGSAVLASEAGAWQDIVREGIDGHIAACDDLTSTQEKLDLMMSDPTQLVEMGTHGRERVQQHYSLEREARDLTDFLRSLAVVE